MKRKYIKDILKILLQIDSEYRLMKIRTCARTLLEIEQEEEMA